MTTAFWIAIGIAVLVIIIWRMMIPSLSGVINEAKEKNDITPIVEAVDQLKPSAQPAAYNHAIRRIWDDYERPLAITLVKELARKHHSTLIAQYWLKQVMQVEPQMAREQIDKEFFEKYYQAELAAQCGPVG